tara:strand:- start:560 stop:1489 length:930 start_codon:yes stop_codon:yes gene_type:complete
MFSPIVFFAYKRPFHTFHSLNALSKNIESKNTDLIAYIDGPSNVKELHLIDSVENIINSFRQNFKSLTIHRSDINNGLAKNISDGITNTLKTYENVITLEDDICVSSSFLKYMNFALKKYQNNHEVWHINAFNLPIDSDVNKEYVFLRIMFCWGWATWRDRWFSFINDNLARDPYYLSFVFNKEMRGNLDLGLRFSPFWSQVEQNKKNKITWAIFWYCHIFMKKGLCLTPSISFVNNIGLDGSGVNCGSNNVSFQNKLNNKFNSNLPDYINEDEETIRKIKDFYKKNKINIFRKIIRKLKKIVKLLIVN